MTRQKEGGGGTQIRSNEDGRQREGEDDMKRNDGKEKRENTLEKCFFTYH